MIQLEKKKPATHAVFYIARLQGLLLRVPILSVFWADSTQNFRFGCLRLKKVASYHYYNNNNYNNNDYNNNNNYSTCMYLFLKNYVTSEGVVPHNVLYYQQLSNAMLPSQFLR
jgi:hypothetical protein